MERVPGSMSNVESGHHAHDYTAEISLNVTLNHKSQTLNFPIAHETLKARH